MGDPYPADEGETDEVAQVAGPFYFSGTIISDSRTYGTIGAILGILTWLVAIGAVIIIGAVAGVVWAGRPRNGSHA